MNGPRVVPGWSPRPEWKHRADSGWDGRPSPAGRCDRHDDDQAVAELVGRLLGAAAGGVLVAIGVGLVLGLRRRR